METSSEDVEEEQSNSSQSSISNLLGAPIDLIKRLIPGASADSLKDEDVPEMVGDRLRKKRMRSKRKSGGIVRRHSFDSDMRKKTMGRNRSMVRYIGSNMPLAPSKRAYFELLNHSSKGLMSHASSFISKNYDQVRQHMDQVKHRVVPSLADLGQIMWEDLNFFDNMNEEPAIEDKDEDDDDFIMFKAESKENDSETSENKEKPVETEAVSSSKQEEKSVPADSAKISALEDELAKLRAQIAMIVSSQQAAPSVTVPQVAIVPPTPIKAPGPPPPPPPPPPPLASSDVIDWKAQLKRKSSTENKKQNEPNQNMDDVLKGIATVKLKTVDISRSPGGTPLKKNIPLENSNNHADIIARALKEKFKNANIHHESPERGSPDTSFSDSPPIPVAKRATSKIERPIPKPRPRPRK